MGRVRGPCCDHQEGVKKGPWNTAEDMKLIAYIQKNGHDNWRALPKKAGLMRCGKSCRLRWINYLNPDIKRGNFSKEEEETIITLHKSLGNKWAKIASHLPGRTDNEIKNIWNTYIKKRLGEEPSTTRRINTKKTLKASLSHSSSFSSMSSCVSNINSNDPDMEFARMLEGDLCLKSSLSTSNSYVLCSSKSKMAESEDQAQSNYMSNDIGEENPFEGLLKILDDPKEDPFEGLLEILDDPNKNFTHILEDKTNQQYKTTIMLEEPNTEGDWVAYLENELGLNDNNVENDEKVVEIDLDPVATYFCD